MIKMIGEKSTVIGVIGDIAQSIYSFQGARPSQFSELTFDSTTNLVDYTIIGNRRSTANIVGFCNYIRKSDTTVVQSSVRQYTNKTVEEIAEAKPILFMIGDSDANKQIITETIENGGVILTRTWAKAFSYIRNIDDEQVKLLGTIYGTYSNTPIDIRSEISEIGNVTWVRAFKFIFLLHRAYDTGSFIDALKALNLYADIDRRTLNLKLLHQIKSLANEVFSDLSDMHKTVATIENLSATLGTDKYSLLRNELFSDEFTVPVFDDYDLTSSSDRSIKFVNALRGLSWSTSYKLFTEVFSQKSCYMTVHQAKGLEWDKVIVSVEPSRFDKTNISAVYTNPQILQETPAEEFVRMYYVACSRAKEN
jgi:superfamily I DNA/RNA helicase